MKICVRLDSGFTKELLERIPLKQVLTFDKAVPTYEAFLAGQCNVMASDSAPVAKRIIHALGYSGEIAIGKKEYTTESYSAKTLDGDIEWTNFVNAVSWALLDAEQNGITQETAEEMGKTDLFGDEYKTIFIDAIKAGGNFGEIYDLPPPRTGKNSNNNGTSGLLVSPPLGDIEKQSIFDLQGSTLDAIMSRGVLNCGILGGRPGFATYNSNLSTWEGMDIDFCKAVAASLFAGREQNIVFHDVRDSMGSNGFALLHNGTVDIFAGSLWTLQSSIKENVTKSGYAFTQPYFYGPVNDTR